MLEYIYIGIGMLIYRDDDHDTYCGTYFKLINSVSPSRPKKNKIFERYVTNILSKMIMYTEMSANKHSI